jgi:hypothetical protein
MSALSAESTLSVMTVRFERSKHVECRDPWGALSEHMKRAGRVERGETMGALNERGERFGRVERSGPVSTMSAMDERVEGREHGECRDREECAEQAQEAR